MPLIWLQRAEWPASVVHDTVAAIARGLEYRRSLRQSFLDRMFLWVGEAIAKVIAFIRQLPSSRTIGLTILGIIVALIVLRIVVAALARDDTRARRSRRDGARAGEDPFAVADRFAAEGRYEDAAHALYHGVLLALARSERVRLDPSKTSGDYARELRKRGSASYQPFRTFSRRFDVAVFGHGGCDAQLIDDLRRLSAPFAGRARAA